jgi:hypothetical protein
MNERAYGDGASAARQAIADGVPRWIHTTARPFGESIDPDTGLPVATLSGPPELADSNASFAIGFNDEILAGIRSGEVTVDFRPLIMPRQEVLLALTEFGLGTLSTENPRVQAPNGDFVLELQLSKKRTKSKLTWIRYSHRSGEEWPQFDLYHEPVEIAVGRNGRVLILSTSCLLLTRDVETTQVLISYPV